MRKLEIMRTIYCVALIIVTVCNMVHIFFYSDDFTNSQFFGWFQLTLVLFYVLIYSFTVIYFLDMTNRMQNIFRKFRQVQGYYGEVFALVIMILICSHSFFYITYGIVVFRINTSDYICSDSMSKYIGFSYD